MKNDKKQTGRVNYIWVLAGGYLIYLAVQIFKTVFAGESDAPVFGIAGGGVFVVLGVLLLLREWKAYRFALAHKDDPSTWSDEAYEEEAAELPESDGEEEV
ncbi:MAG: hypothetical protein E7429_01915 [Ruminococcaceae bacterium]|nr:hypothetical protein [Oscillospiraceae bacterium]